MCRAAGFGGSRPLRSSSASAATLARATASTTVLGPVTMSPTANTRGLEVVPDPSVARSPLPVTSSLLCGSLDSGMPGRTAPPMLSSSSDGVMP